MIISGKEIEGTYSKILAIVLIDMIPKERLKKVHYEISLLHIMMAAFDGTGNVDQIITLLQHWPDKPKNVEIVLKSLSIKRQPKMQVGFLDLLAGMRVYKQIKPQKLMELWSVVRDRYQLKSFSSKGKGLLVDRIYFLKELDKGKSYDLFKSIVADLQNREEIMWSLWTLLSSQVLQFSQWQETVEWCLKKYPSTAKLAYEFVGREQIENLGISWKIENIFGTSPIATAIIHKNVEFVKMFIDCDVDFDVRDWSLTAALRRGLSEDLIIKIMQKKPNFSLPDGDGVYPVMAAIAHKDLSFLVMVCVAMQTPAHILMRDDMIGVGKLKQNVFRTIMRSRNKNLSYDKKKALVNTMIYLAADTIYLSLSNALDQSPPLLFTQWKYFKDSLFRSVIENRDEICHVYLSQLYKYADHFAGQERQLKNQLSSLLLRYDECNCFKQDSFLQKLSQHYKAPITQDDLAAAIRQEDLQTFQQLFSSSHAPQPLWQQVCQSSQDLSFVNSIYDTIYEREADHRTHYMQCLAAASQTYNYSLLQQIITQQFSTSSTSLCADDVQAFYDLGGNLELLLKFLIKSNEPLFAKSFEKHVEHLGSLQIEKLMIAAAKERLRLQQITEMMTLWAAKVKADKDLPKYVSAIDESLPKILRQQYGEAADPAILSYLNIVKNNPVLFAYAVGEARLFDNQCQKFLNIFAKILGGNKDEEWLTSSRFFSRFFYRFYQNNRIELVDDALVALADNNCLGPRQMTKLLQQYYYNKYQEELNTSFITSIADTKPGKLLQSLIEQNQYGERQDSAEALTYFLVQHNLPKTAKILDPSTYEQWKTGGLGSQILRVAKYFATNPGVSHILTMQKLNASLINTLKSNGCKVKKTNMLSIKLPLHTKKWLATPINIDLTAAKDDTEQAVLQLVQQNMTHAIAKQLNVSTASVIEYLHKSITPPTHILPKDSRNKPRIAPQNSCPDNDIQ
ncbi:MAG: hypothetical protein AAF320_04035 [Myxococcota bacterium]